MKFIRNDKFTIYEDVWYLKFIRNDKFTIYEDVWCLKFKRNYKFTIYEEVWCSLAAECPSLQLIGDEGGCLLSCGVHLNQNIR